MSRISQISFFFFLLFTLIQCNKSEEDPVNVVNVPEGDGFPLLSEYNFFTGNLHELNANEEAGVLPYDLNMPLFSDYASKKRFIYVPKGSVIPYEAGNTLDLPVGSILIKHFYYPNAGGVEKYIETRLLIHRADGWQAETYEWNAEQTDASRNIIGGNRVLTATVNGSEQTFNYLIPNVNQCKNCHAFNGKQEPIGPVIENLNKNFDYSSGTANQIDKWIANGILEAPIQGVVPHWPKLDDSGASIENRARAYLAVNCSSCHRLEGSAANSGLYLEYENQDSLSLGFWKNPVAAGGGSGGLTYVIKPGYANESIILYRMISDVVNERMPEIGRNLSHEQGIALIREWIDNM